MNGTGQRVLTAATVHPTYPCSLGWGNTTICGFQPALPAHFPSIEEPNQCSDRGSKEVTTYLDEAWNHIHPVNTCLKKALVSFIPWRTDRYEKKVLYWAETAVIKAARRISVVHRGWISILSDSPENIYGNQIYIPSDAVTCYEGIWQARGSEHGLTLTSLGKDIGL